MVTAGEAGAPAPSADAWFAAFRDHVEAGHAQLTELDRLAGDGDFGGNLLGAIRRADALHLEGQAPFRALYLSFLDAGGTSGPLLGMWFRAFSAETADGLSASTLAAAARRGLDAIQAAGGAQPGDNTMVDAMAPAVEAIEGFAPDADPALVLQAAAEASERGAESTGALLGRKGRSSYVGDHALGVVDPGALAVAWFFAAAVDTAPHPGSAPGVAATAADVSLTATAAAEVSA